MIYTLRYKDWIEKAYRDLRHMKINNKSKFAMGIFYQARRQSAIIAGLLWHFADVA